ncbi:hypothetical protein [Stenotrophomonas maltophilia]|uniref:hypothetical protein n=1 Tax=Stenotrophomonas maltophilia TaxID=40324 RepID=UPI0021C9F916|nr:hypothetical protein [Stenotrophomonas maltophilia]MCU1169993.1 hypothetical protein [Stenotrophomonas maltophilia]
MSSELVIVKLDGPEGDVSNSRSPRYSAMRLTITTSVSGGDDVGFAFLDVNGNRIDANSPEEVGDTLQGLDQAKSSPVGSNSTLVTSWDAFSEKFDPHPVEVSETEFVSETLGFLVRRVSLWTGTAWHLPACKFVVIPSFGTSILGAYSRPGDAVGLAKSLDQEQQVKLAHKGSQFKR